MTPGTRAGFAPAVRVELGERSYDIRFSNGDVAGVAAAIAERCCASAFIISNDVVWKLHGEEFSAALTAAGVTHQVGLMEDGERFKTMATVDRLLNQLLEARMTRQTVVVAFGGGVVGDVAGFVASIFLRGVDYVQVPTTVVAMVDSSVGGKTGVDHHLGKNLIGAFWQPRLVAVDLAYLRTLDAHNISGGLAEVIKYGVIRDPGLFEFLESSIESVIGLEAAALSRVVTDSCRIKAEVVAADEREGGLRAILNYGHTFGHAIEAVEEYRERQFHGQAVAIGMVAASRLARRLGMFSDAEAERLENLISRAGLPVALPTGVDPDAVVEAMKSDKKVKDGRLRFVLPAKIGEVVLRDGIARVDIRAALLG